MIVRCIGCGSILQDEDPNKIGYVPKISKGKENSYCKRCFRLNHYNELPKITATKEDYERVVDSVLSKNGLMVLLVDIFDFQGSFIPNIISRLRPKNVILVANKFDLLPKSTNVSKVVDWLSNMCQRIFFKVDAIHVVSSKKGYYIDDLINTIDLLRNGKDVYFVGCANVGKSSLINAILKRCTTKTEDVIATSVIPGTTIDAITIPFFEDNKALIDTPGLINEENIIHQLLPVSYDKILPSREIKPITYQLLVDNTIFISGLAYVSFIEGEMTGFTCYFSEKLLIHRTKTNRVEDLLANHLGGLLVPPSLEEVPNIIYEETIFKIKGPKKQDIVISGLGFITVNKPVIVKVNVIKGTRVFIREAIIGN